MRRVRQQALESNAQAKQRYDDQHARRQEELQLSSGIGYGLSSALIVGGGIGVGVTTALNRRNQPVEQTTTTTHTVVQQQTGGNTPAQGGTDATRAEDTSLNRRDSQGSVASTHWSDSSSGVVNPYAEVGEPRNSLSTRQQEEHIYDEVAADPGYSVIQNFSRNAPVTGRLMGSQARYPKYLCASGKQRRIAFRYGRINEWWRERSKYCKCRTNAGTSTFRLNISVSI